MSERAYKVITVVGVSNESFSKAADAAVEKASQTLNDLAWFEVVEQRGAAGDGGVTEYQVKVNVAFRLHD